MKFSQVFKLKHIKYMCEKVERKNDNLHKFKCEINMKRYLMMEN